jgi:hypothetical protein
MHLFISNAVQTYFELSKQNQKNMLRGFIHNLYVNQVVSRKNDSCGLGKKTKLLKQGLPCDMILSFYTEH